MTIREAHVQDAETLADMIRLSHRDVAERFHLTQENCPKHPSFCLAAWVQADFQRGVRYFFLTTEGRPCGCVALERASDQEMYVERLSVLPHKRRRGAGVRLVAHALGEAANLGVDTLGIGIISEFTELKAWYRSLGFEAVSVKHFDHLPFEVCFMTRWVPVTV
ncbi:GNAT family N-acetyltransferase [Desulfoluna spongiiphila]|nr:GNAT family N-acetyltransferase [Desulfoluna spongiiphila]